MLGVPERMSYQYLQHRLPGNLDHFCLRPTDKQLTSLSLVWDIVRFLLSLLIAVLAHLEQKLAALGDVVIGNMPIAA